MLPSPSIDSALVALMRPSLSTAAQLLLPSEPSYESAIQSWNLDATARPPLVILPACTDDVAAAVSFLRNHSLPFTVGGGRHSRFSKREGHVLLSLSLMRSVTVDKAARVVRAQGGALNGDVDKVCATVNMFCSTSYHPSTGIGGLILGGGIGALSRRQGLSIDCLQQVELVTADGKVLRVSDTEQPELFWAMRGAGYNFGVVTEFVLRIQPVGHQLRSLTAEDEAVMAKHALPAQEQLEHKVVRAGLVYPLSQFTSIAQKLQTQYIEPGRDGPLGDRDLTITVGMVNPPNGPIALVTLTHAGDVLRGYAAVDRLVAQLGSPLQPLSAAVRYETYLEHQNALVHIAKPGHYQDRAFIALELSPQFATALQSSFKELAQCAGMEASQIRFWISGVQGAISDHMGETAFSDEQRRGNIVIQVVSQSDRTKMTRSQSNDWLNRTREAILPYCIAPYTNAQTAQVRPHSYRVTRADYHCSIEELHAFRSPNQSLTQSTVCSVDCVAWLCGIVRCQSTASATNQAEMGSYQPVL